jgi:Domain of unknown function (DUF4157)
VRDGFDEEEPGPVSGGEAEEEGASAEPGRPALSEEIARRWDPARMLRMVSAGAGRGEPLDALTRARFERRLDTDLGGVRVYTGEFAEKVTARHSAEAVTVGGTGMIFMSGTPDRSPATASGRALLAHELTHVAQSSRGIYRSAPDQRPPLATEEHEAEAEAVEAEEAAAGGRPPEKPETIDPEKASQELLEIVTARVLELVYEDERVHVLRNGEPRHRP